MSKQSEQKKLPEKVAKALALLPKESGVYQFYDVDQKLLYVGKAKVLRSRVGSYFQASANHSVKTRKMVAKIHDLKWIVTQSEVEALVLESNLVHEHQPPFNILLKDDKSFLYLKITNEPFPRVMFTRRLKKDAAAYFGPFIKGKEVRQAIDYLREILQFRTCKLEINEAGETTKNPENRKLPCLDYQIKVCTAPCVAKISMTEYAKDITQLKQFFKGNNAPIKQRIAAKIEQAAADLLFEKAAKMRDILRFIERMQAPQVAELPLDFEADVIGMFHGVEKSFFHVFAVRQGKIVRSLPFTIKTGEDEAQTLQHFLREYLLLVTDVPQILVLPQVFPNNEINLWQEFTTELTQRKVEIKLPQKGKFEKLLCLAIKNAGYEAAKSRASFEAIDVVEEVQKALSLIKRPERIECYDISHLAGTEMVGSRVVFIDGTPAKSEYRRYKIQTVERGDIDDFKAMAEVLGRRLKRLQSQRPHFTLEEIDDEERQQEITMRLEELGMNAFQQPETQFALHNILDDEVVGYACVRKYGTVLELGGVVVLPEFRGQAGAGTEMVKAVICESKAKTLRAIVAADNLRWIKSLKTLGFTEEKKPPQAMQKELERRTSDDQKQRVCLSIQPAKMRRSIEKVPDLLVIDGGKGQLSAVLKVLQKYKLFAQIPICSLAKKHEEIFVPGRAHALPIPKDHAANKLLQQIRDEAHRFAIGFNKQLRNKSMTQSLLDSIPGVGPKLKKDLLIKFGSVEKIAHADVRDLAEVTNSKTASLIHDFFVKKGMA